MNRLLLLCAVFALALSANGQPDTTLPTGTKPFVLGAIDGIDSKILGERRVLNIYLPEGYGADATTKYPVVYLLDGAADEDFIHVVGLYQFNSFSWINRVPKSIIVGIANVDRKRDFTFPSTVSAEQKAFPTSGHSDQFIRFLGRELQPFIQHKYKAASTKTIIGESLGGLLAAEILLKKPVLFDHYIIISPSLWWSDGALLNASVKTLSQPLRDSIKIYVGVGKEGLLAGPCPRMMEVDANVLAEKLKASGNKSLRVYFDYLPGENHATVAHQAIFNALRMLYPVSEP